MTSTERSLLAAGTLLAGSTAVLSLMSSGPAAGTKLLPWVALAASLLVCAAWVALERRARTDAPSGRSGGREAILGAVAEAAERFLSEGVEAMPVVLEQLAGATGASRVYVWENHEGEGGALLTSQRYEWVAPGIDPQIDNPELQALPYEEAGLGRWARRLGAGMTIHGPLRAFPSRERAILDPQRIRSLVAVPIFVGDEWWGFIGVDDCVRERAWSAGEIDALRAAAGALGGAIHRARAMELLEQAEAKYRAIVEKIPAAIFLDALDGKATTLWVSPQIEEILGFPAEEWLADPDLWMRQMHPADRDRVAAATVRHNETLEPFGEEYRIFHRDGRLVWVRDEAVITYDDEGRPRFSQGFFMDVTEGKRAEAQERRHSEYLSAIHETALGLMDRLEVDGLLQAIVGRAAELLGTGHGFVYLPDETGERMEMKVGVGALTEAVGLQAGRGEGAAGLVWERGEPVVISDYAGWEGRLSFSLDVSSVVAVPLGSRNEVVGVLGLAHMDPELGFTDEDVEHLVTFAEFASIALDNARLYEAAQRELAERKRAQAELEEQEERFRTLSDSALEGICIHDRGTITEVNRAFAEMFRMPPEELVGTQVLELLAPEDREMAARRIEEQSEEVGRHEGVRGDGSRFAVELVGRRIPYRGREARVLAIRDITERRRAEESLREAYEREREAAEQLRHVDEMKNAFLTAVSHELRTPLSAILGFALTLERESLSLSPAEVREMVDRIVANARKLDSLLTDLLDLDRISRGILEATRRPTDVGDLVHRVVEGADLAGRRVLVEAQELVAQVDGPKVERIVENLLANAAKYTPPGTPVWVRLVRRPGGVLIAVEDAGPGVELEQRDAIFRPFTQGEDAPAHAPGTGIGLSLVARFAEMHGGSAWVEDREGGGASFRVFLAAAEVESSELPRAVGFGELSDRSSQ
ncbi:MAG TPA: PAS domain S-box protein [Actinomycetota bacterium]